ncbi:MAG: rubredoxin [Candidatus Methanoperedens sp.]|nr:rubredoxin [Candidatus Methanoperedens sp.]
MKKVVACPSAPYYNNILFKNNGLEGKNLTEPGMVLTNFISFYSEFIKEDFMAKYRCVCNYVYDGEKEDKRFSDLPSDWKCPLCNAPKTSFELLES